MNSFEEASSAQRHQVIQGEETPSNVRKIEQYLVKNHGLRHRVSRVSLNFDPGILREGRIDYIQLINELKGNYGLNFVTPEILKKAVASETLSDELFIDILNTQGLIFRDGVVDYEENGDKRSLIISQFSLGSQNISVDLNSSTREAEIIVKKLASDVFKNQGVNVNRRIFEANIDGVNYFSSTVLNLGFDPMYLLSDFFRQFVHNDIDQSLGYQMVSKPRIFPVDDNKDYIISSHLEKLHIKIAVFNQRSGHHDYYEFIIDYYDRRLRSTGVVIITSELKYEDHIRALKLLVEKYEAQSSS